MTEEKTNETLSAVDHTHPHTNRTFGGNFTFARGGAVAADGGRPDVVPEAGDAPTDADRRATMADVAHTPPNDSEDANRVFARGSEGPARDATRPGVSARGRDDRSVDDE